MARRGQPVKATHGRIWEFFDFYISIERLSSEFDAVGTREEGFTRYHGGLVYRYRPILLVTFLAFALSGMGCSGANTGDSAVIQSTSTPEIGATASSPSQSVWPTVTSTQELSSPTPSPTATATPTPTPGPATYRLRPGDTLSAVAANAGVPLGALLTENGLRADQVVKKGLLLQLPAGSIPPELWPSPTPRPLPTFVTEMPPAEAPIIYLGPEERRQVALTFDTGYDPDINREIARLLAERGVRATFFVVGRGAAQYPEVVEDLIATDQELANHSWSHQDLTTMTTTEVRDELRRTDMLVQEQAPGATTKPFFRAPFGYVNETVEQVARDEGFYIVDWTFDSLDWIEGITPEEVRWTVERRLRPGAIVVMHGSSSATLEALPVVLDLLEREGYEAVPLSNLLVPPH